MSTIARANSVILACFFLVACDPSWPPRRKEYVSNFFLHRSAIEKLESELKMSDYEYIDGVVPGEVRAEREGRIPEVLPFLEESESSRWTKLFGDSGVYSVELIDELTVFGIESSSGVGDDFQAVYVHAPDQSQETNECKQAYAGIRCGACGVYLDEDWWIHFSWSNFLSEAQIEDWISSGTLNDEENVSVRRAAEESCKAEGRRILGYPP